MMLCAVETSLIEGSSSMMQLMQSCILTAMGVVQRQSVVVQVWGNAKWMRCFNMWKKFWAYCHRRLDRRTKWKALPFTKKQKILEQDTIQDIGKGWENVLTWPASNCLARMMSSKERRAVTARWSSSSRKSQCEQVTLSKIYWPRNADVAAEVRNATIKNKGIMTRMFVPLAKSCHSCGRG